MKRIGISIISVGLALFLFFSSTTKQRAQTGGFTKTNVATGTGPIAVAINSTTNKIYVANSDSNDVTVIDGGNNSTTTVTSVVVTGTHAQITGKANINRSGPFDFIIDVDDLHQPGKGADKFRIRLSNGYDLSGTLSKGDIRIRLRACEERDDSDRDDHLAGLSDLYQSMLVDAWRIIGSVLIT